MSTRTLRPRGLALAAALACCAAVASVAAAAPEPVLDETNSWAFSSADDCFRPDPGLDLSTLNEGVAGASGFVRRSADGASFVDGAGRPIRFWAVVVDLRGMGYSFAEMEELLRFLSKRGVNMIRLFANLDSKDRGASLEAVRTEEVERVLAWVSAAKRHGIYTTICPFWAWDPAPASWGLEGIDNTSAWGVPFFNEKFQNAYKGWMRALLTTRSFNNGGVPLCDEPALALVQVFNEDSLLFWTIDAIPAPQKRILGARFLRWAAAKYGSPEKALAAWGGTAAEGDDVPGGVFGLRPLRELTSHAPAPTGPLAVRLADQTEFLTTTQRGFYAEMTRFFREDLGVKSLVNATNWRAADFLTLDDAERYTYTVADVSAVNYYTGGAHVGENCLYRIDPGHRYTSASVFRGEAPFTGNLKQTSGMPMFITEAAWVLPTLYAAEGPFLMAAYNSLTGVDAAFWFDYRWFGAPQWMQDPRWPEWPAGNEHATWKWFGAYPMQAGQFPAYALAFRRGYIREAAEPAVHEERTLDDLWKRRTPIIVEQGKFDPARDPGAFAPESPIRAEIDRAAFFVGPVTTKVPGDPRKTRTVDLARYIDATTGDVRSLTGELLINQRRGFATVDAPCIQAVGGFLRDAGGDFPLADVRWRSTNHYATLAAVSVDGAPLAKSGLVLVQAGTYTRLTGYRTRPATIEEDGVTLQGQEVVANGAPPWRVANTEATLVLRNSAITRATALDPNLYRVREVPIQREGGTVTIHLPTDALYLLLESSP
jgi:hypothetical protein